MATVQDITTAQQLLSTSDLGRCELVRGELNMMSPSGFEHGAIVGLLTELLVRHVKENKLGVVTGAESGFLLSQDPDTVRAPDVGFIRAERVPSEPVRGYFPGAPDLAIEVLSPSDRASQVLAKVNDWLSAGCRAVWVVDPESRCVNAYHGPNEFVVWTDQDELEGGDVVPGFCFPVSEIFRS